jgi:hypothetical protein
MPSLTREQRLAADLFGYSYAHYADHLGDLPGEGNVRFERLMPEDVKVLERAERENWKPARLAKALEIAEDKVERYREMYRQAKDIVDAPTPAESFRRGVRHSIENAMQEGLSNARDVEKLVTQICYRAADLGYVLDAEGEQLSDYSEELREEPPDDDEVLGAGK